jgi:hypothetical protein
MVGRGGQLLPNPGRSCPAHCSRRRSVQLRGRETWTCPGQVNQGTSGLLESPRAFNAAHGHAATEGIGRPLVMKYFQTALKATFPEAAVETALKTLHDNGEFKKVGDELRPAAEARRKKALASAAHLTSREQPCRCPLVRHERAWEGLSYPGLMNNWSLG